MSALKTTCLRFGRTIGLFPISRRLTRRGMRILCYHGSSLADEHRFRPTTFMTLPTFRRRMEYLASRRFAVLALDDATKRTTEELPPNAVVLTFDDGFYSTYRDALPVLAEFGFPATIYVTTYYSVKQTPVFRLVVQYMFWKTGVEGVDLSGLCPGYESRTPLGTEGQKRQLAWSIIRYGEEQCTEPQRGAISAELGTRLRVDYQALVRDRLFSIMTPEEIRHAGDLGFSIQLHTHRHRCPDDEIAVRREIVENRAVLAPLVRQELDHFCYPSGVWSPRQFEWLAESGIKSATTCDPGLNYPDTPRLAMRRYLDSQGIAQVDFQAEVNGLTEICRRVRSGLRHCVPNGPPPREAV